MKYYLCLDDGAVFPSEPYEVGARHVEKCANHGVLLMEFDSASEAIQAAIDNGFEKLSIQGALEIP